MNAIMNQKQDTQNFEETFKADDSGESLTEATALRESKFYSIFRKPITEQLMTASQSEESLHNPMFAPPPPST